MNLVIFAWKGFGLADWLTVFLTIGQCKRVGSGFQVRPLSLVFGSPGYRCTTILHNDVIRTQCT